MNRTYTNVILAIVVVILLCIFIVVLRSPSSPNLPAVISVATSTIQSETPIYSIKADYPVFGIPDLDSQILEAVNVGVSNIEGTPANPSPNGIKNEFISSYDSVYTDANIASARLILSEYTGGAHNISVAVGFNYDRKAEKLLTLDDALAFTGDSLAQVATLAKTQLTKQFGAVQFPEGLDPTPENFATFVVNKDSVIFTIQEYQAEPFSDGMPEIVIPRVR